MRRIVGRLDPDVVEKDRKRRADLARQIDGLPLSWPEKVARWKEQTGVDLAKAQITTWLHGYFGK